jgi:hypothetical protein
MSGEQICSKETAMQLPAPIQAYFDADRDPRSAAPIHTFATGAVVKDEGKAHVGHEAITAWWRTAKAQYQHSAEPSDILVESGLTIVRTQVTGQFPGSPALLTFAFQLEAGRIAALEIGA